MLRDGGHRDLPHGPPFPGPPGPFSLHTHDRPPPAQGQRLLQDPVPYDPMINTHMMSGAVSPMMSPSNGIPERISHSFRK